MDYQNDERYWNIKLLNKWFLFAAFLWTLSMIWMFIDDNDDEYKYYQSEFFKRKKEKVEKQFNQLSIELSESKKALELEIENELKLLEDSKDQIEDFLTAMKEL